MNVAPKTDNKQPTKGGPLPGLLKPPIVLLSAILVGIALNRTRPMPFRQSMLVLLGPLVSLCAAALFLLSYREFRAAGTFIRGNQRTTAIVQSAPYRFSRNPIYLSFVLPVLGLSFWLYENDLWLLLTLVPAVGFIAVVVILREEWFLERNFPDQYSSYKATVRRWMEDTIMGRCKCKLAVGITAPDVNPCREASWG